MLDLSIIIVGYNNARYLEDCLHSIYQSPPPVNFEIIYIDNNSSDQSVSLLKEKFPQVRLIENRSNLGFSRANNQGLKIYRGRFALLLNTDTLVKAGALDQLVAFMQAHPRAGVCGPKLLNPDGSIQHQGGLLAKKFWRLAQPKTVDYVIGAALLARREAIDIVGGLDENLFFSNEDLDWCRSIHKAGWEIYFVPQAEIVHYGGYTTRKFDQRLFVEGFRGGLYFCRKYYGPIVYQLYRWLLVLLAFPAILVSIGNRKKAGAFWRIFLIALTGQIYPSLPGTKNILLVSNGHAEDLAAATIGSKVRELDQDAGIKALPLVGLGKAYDRINIRNLGIRKTLPSGGFAKEGWRFLLRDLISGLPFFLSRQIKILKREAAKADLILAVGDAYLVGLCGIFGRKPLVFVDGPKSVKIEGYWKIEEILMRRYCRKIIVQDQATADYLQKKKLPALYLGSWVMDYVPVTGVEFAIEPAKTVIGILPGTREEAYANLWLALEVLDELNIKAPEKKIVGLVASTLDHKKIKQKVNHRGWQLSETTAAEKKNGMTGKLISRRGTEAYLVEGLFGDVCVRSRLIIGLAGIANEQAVAFGKPTVCFVGQGPQTTRRRFEEIQKITGQSMLILDGGKAEKAAAILNLLNDPEKMKKMAEIGHSSKPDRGACARIADLVLRTAKKLA